MRIRMALVGGRRSRRLVSLLVLASLLAAHFPVPVPATHSDKDRSSRFPCEDSPCGCRSAEQCWRGCCCCTHAEKLAWARRNGVTPPAFVVEAARKEAASETSRTCCSESGDCSDHQDESSDSACCDAGHASLQPASAEGESEGGKTRFIIGIAAMRCQGQSFHWLSLPWMAPSSNEPSRPNVLVVPLLVAQDCGVPEVTDSPPTPPPRAKRCIVSCV